jgi:hypothetical protein
VNFKKTPLSQRRSEPSSSKPVLGVLVSWFVIGFALSCFTANAARIPARAGIQSDLIVDVGSGFEEPFQGAQSRPQRGRRAPAVCDQ